MLARLTALGGSHMPENVGEDRERVVALTSDVGDTKSEALPIGGWLWLPLIGLFLGAANTLLHLFTNFQSLVERENLAHAASAPGLPTSPLSLILLRGIGIQFALAGTLTWVAVRFLQRKRNVPMLVSGLLILDLVLLVALYAFGRKLEPRLAIGVVVGAAIWVPYFLRSARVKRTFRL
jgi:hypothetical protein